MPHLRLDDRYTVAVLSRVALFRCVHPNVITVVGLAMDFVVLYAVAIRNPLLLAVSMFVRYSCDCLDGAVARKYGKVSTVGGALDTIADNVFVLVIVWAIFGLAGVTHSFWVAVAVTAANVAYLWRAKALVHHGGIKIGGTWVQNVYSAGVNNNAVLYLAAFCVLWGLM